MESPKESPAPDEQARILKPLLEAKLLEGQTWYVICYKWWSNWKAYTGCGIGSEAMDSSENPARTPPPFPGEIDNSILHVPGEPDELRREMVEGFDYCLIPQAAYQWLDTWYGTTGPAFPRTVVAQGVARVCAVELYPVKFVLFRCADTGLPDPASKKVTFFSRSKTVSQVRATALHTLGVEVGEATRISFKLVECTENGAKEGGGADWNIMDTKQMNMLLQDVLGDMQGEIHMLVEQALAAQGDGMNVTVKSSGDQESAGLVPTCFPRDKIVNQWRLDLAPGDLVDAMDSDGRWFESKVLSVNETDSDLLMVHYKGWASKWDAELPRMSQSIQPLYTHSENWREDLKIGTKIELVDSEAASPKWFKAEVEGVEGDVICVKCPSNSELSRKVDRNGEEICNAETHIQEKKTTPRSVSGLSQSPWFRSRHTKGSPDVPGAVGLSNLGNTCFMNSMLQCLSNTELLTNYFINRSYEGDLNRDNPLGMNGEVAMSYANLLHDMWGGKYTIVVPAEFKKTISQFQPQFAGYHQQDSQELMSFLLDGLHEDLNRVRNKPYVPAVESAGRADAVVAEESWQRYLMRNDSVIVDNCQGLLRSHVTCPACGFESITFDPYMSLSLPLPVESVSEVKALLQPLPLGSRPIKVSQALPSPLSGFIDLPSPVPSDAKLDAVLKWMVESFPHLGLKEDQLASADTWSHKISKDLHPDHPVADIKSVAGTDVVVYQLAHKPPARKPAAQLSIASYGTPSSQVADHAKAEEDPSPELAPAPAPAVILIDVVLSKALAPGGYDRRVPLFGQPLRLCCPGGTTNREVHTMVGKHISRFFDLARVGSPTAMETDDSILVTSHAVNGEGGAAGDEDQPPLEVLRLMRTHFPSPSEVEKLPVDDEPFKEMAQGETVCVMFSKEGEKGIDLKELEAEDEHPSLSEGVERKANITVIDCFNKFIEREQLGENDPWYCSSCQGHRQAYKKFSLWSTPDVLILHMKRFQYMPSQYSSNMLRQKITDLVTFPTEELDLTTYIDEAGGPKFPSAPPIYDLFAVSEHSGGLRGGHYTTTAQNFRNKQWYSFNDAQVGRTEADSGVSSEAYVLFYKRRHGSLRWSGQSGKERPAAA
ncbi:unnamed protein product [Chrysoparadoxa australica]